MGDVQEVVVHVVPMRLPGPHVAWDMVVCSETAVVTMPKLPGGWWTCYFVKEVDYGRGELSAAPLSSFLRSACRGFVKPTRKRDGSCWKGGSIRFVDVCCCLWALFISFYIQCVHTNYGICRGPACLWTSQVLAWCEALPWGDAVRCRTVSQRHSMLFSS